jgi:O-antigen/teichoic acid export membrane protein
VKSVRVLAAVTRQSLTRLRLDTPAEHTLTQRGALSTVGLLAQGVLRFATSWLIGRLAGKVVLGTVQAAISTASLLALLWPTTTGSAASKYLARARGAGDDEELHAVATHFRKRALLTSGVLALAAVPFWVLYDDGGWLDGLWVGIFTAAYSGYSFIRGVQFGTGQVARATTWDVLSALLGLSALGVLLLLGVRGPALLVALSLSYGLYIVAGWPRGVRPGARLDPVLRREMDHFVALGAAGSLANAGFLQLSMLVAKGVDHGASGQFAAAMVTATPASMLAASLSLALFPSLAEAWGSGDKRLFRARTDQATRVLVLVMVTIFGVIILCSRLVMSVLWGAEYDPGSIVLPVLVFALMMTNVAVASINALATRSRRAMQLNSGASFAALAVGALAWWLLTPSMGIEGVAVGFLLGSAVSASAPIIAEWWVGKHSWRLLALRGVAGAALLVALLVGERRLGLPIATEPLVAIVFCAIWWTASWRDLRLLPLPQPVRRFIPRG